MKLLYSAPTPKHRRVLPPEWFDRDLADQPEEGVVFVSGTPLEVPDDLAEQILARAGKRFSVAPEEAEEVQDDDSETPDDDEGEQ